MLEFMNVKIPKYFIHGKEINDILIIVKYPLIGMLFGTEALHKNSIGKVLDMNPVGRFTIGSELVIDGKNTDGKIRICSKGKTRKK